jgi:hypothetical protein
MRVLLRQQAQAAGALASDAREYDIEDLLGCEGLHAVESDGLRRWAWTGPAHRSVLLLPGPWPGRTVRVTLALADAKVPLDAASLRLSVDGKPCRTEFVPEQRSITLLASGAEPACCHRLDILHAALWTTPDHARDIGLAIQKVMVQTVA